MRLRPRLRPAFSTVYSLREFKVKRHLYFTSETTEASPNMASSLPMHL